MWTTHVLHSPYIDLVHSFHQHLNSVDPDIQFTLTKERDGQLPFWNIFLSKDTDGSISTTVYQKATH